MSSLLIALIFFVCTASGVMVGFWFRSKLPGHHVDSEGRDTVKLATGLIATLSALVLGLLVASAKSSFDSVSSGITDQAARIIFLDNLLTDYGPEAAPIRDRMRQSIITVRDTVWPKKGTVNSLPTIESGHGPERLVIAIRRLAPHSEEQSIIKKEALQISEEMAQSRWLVFLHAQAPVPVAFLVCLLFWLIVLHCGFGILSARNVTVVASLLVCALTVSATVFLILELNRPLTGMIKVSSAPFDQAIQVIDEHAHAPPPAQ